MRTKTKNKVKVNVVKGSLENLTLVLNFRGFTDGDGEIGITKKCFLKLNVESDRSKLEITEIQQEMVRCVEKTYIQTSNKIGQNSENSHKISVQN